MKFIKLKKRYLTILVILLVAGGLFYWYEIRPSEIRKKCAEKSVNYISKLIENKDEEIGVDNLTKYIDTIYEVCLKQNGLSK